MVRKLKKNDGVYDPKNPNYEILIFADSVGWSVAKKTKPMWAVELPQDTVIQTIENPAYPGKKGEYLCIGFGEEHWVQSKKNVLGKYIDTGQQKSIKVPYFKEPLVFRLYQPKPDRKVLVCQIGRSFVVVATWAKLAGKPRDFLVKPYDEILNPNPPDVWLVDRQLFNATYKLPWWKKYV